MILPIYSEIIDIIIERRLPLPMNCSGKTNHNMMMLHLWFNSLIARDRIVYLDRNGYIQEVML
jgi:lipopolysaccharide biosynthesis glycosyltransferase